MKARIFCQRQLDTGDEFDGAINYLYNELSEWWEVGKVGMEGRGGKWSEREREGKGARKKGRGEGEREREGRGERVREKEKEDVQGK